MPIWMAAFLFIVGLAGIYFSFKFISKRKKAKHKTGIAVAVGIVFGLMAVMSAVYTAFSLLLIGSVD